MSLRIGIVIAITVLACGAAFLAPALPQWPSYHDFADQRALLGVSNFLDVASNLGFLIVGATGLYVTLSARAVPVQS